MQKVVTSLWFNNCAEQAVDHYTSVFDDARIRRITRYGEAGPEPAGKVMTIEFELAGQAFVAINSDAQFPFTPAISLLVNCHDQAEIDALWEQLAVDPDAGQCGWLVDRFGLSWQIVPDELNDMLNDSDPAKSQAVMRALLSMTKLDLAALRGAYASN
ncbi:MAG: VOC family protein [Gammaproteobacteria bacterium]|nr:VOC family protein [Gammaproteobacteria bacterium]